MAHSLRRASNNVMQLAHSLLLHLMNVLVPVARQTKTLIRVCTVLS